jgi:hypothetical protein
MPSNAFLVEISNKCHQNFNKNPEVKDEFIDEDDMPSVPLIIETSTRLN